MRYKLKAHAKDLLRQILKDHAYDEILKEFDEISTSEMRVECRIASCKSKSGIALTLDLTTYDDYEEIFGLDSWNRLNEGTINRYPRNEMPCYRYLIKDSFGNLSIVSSVERLTPDSDLKVKRVNVNDVLYAFKD